MKLIFFKRRYLFWLSILGVLIIVSILLIDNSLNKISNRHRLRANKDTLADQDIDDDNESQTNKYLNEIQRLKSKVDELEEKSVQNEKSLQMLKDFYSKVQKLNGDKLPALPLPNHFNRDESLIEENANPSAGLINDLMGGNHEHIDLNVFERVKERHKNLIANNQNGRQMAANNKRYLKQCEFFNEKKAEASQIDIYKLFEKLPFDDKDGGVWKQGFEITYDANQWSQQEKLLVLVVPHSHNDPGWLMTFEEYFTQRTKGILNTIVEALHENPTRKFIWAEMSYLSMWWSQASTDMRQKMRDLIVKTKQLEIVTGGWVMTDEANSNYYSIIEQMVLGHEWLKTHIDPSITPKYGWSIDPFGYTPTMAYMLKQMGFNGMLIQRVHYHLKKHFAENLQFEFKWRQHWSTENSKDTSMMCHVMPFYSYDVPHTCGPDPKVCCQFDFKRLPESRSGMSCPWGLQPQAINERNVDERATLLLDQYRKKAQLYGQTNSHNIVLVPLGDDFRYTDMQEAHDQYVNYEKIMNHVNTNERFNAEIRFGTLEDYFVELKKLNEKHDTDVTTKLEGDFFTYADRQDHYWSGYYTSRPFTKRLERLVEAYLRTSEILFSIANLQTSVKFEKSHELYKLLMRARQNLALFQHHDGITGTSKTPVVKDYAQKLYTSLTNCRQIIEQTSSYLTVNPKLEAKLPIYNLDDMSILSETQAANFKPLIVFDLQQQQKVQQTKTLIIFNSNVQAKRHEIISLRVNTPNIEIFDETSKTLISNLQVSLVWPNSEGGTLSIDNGNTRMDSASQLTHALDFEANTFEVLFEVNVKPLGFSKFTIRTKLDSTLNLTRVDFYQREANSEFVNKLKDDIKTKLNKHFVNSEHINFLQTTSNLNENDEDMISLNLGETGSTMPRALFSRRTGFLQKILINSASSPTKLKLKLIKYGVTEAREKSGAYLFLPDGPATDVDTSLFQWIRVEHSGPLRTRVCTNMSLILHCVDFFPTLDKYQNSKYPLVHVWNVVDLRKSHNYELAMHLETSIQNKDFYTDLNGFQYIKRHTHSKLPIQGNVYPMPTGSFIQDEQMRVNILSAQPLGAASLQTSSLQVFLDRRLDQDDNRGMEQAMNDNVLTSNKFLILFESLNTDNSNGNRAVDMPSLTAQWLSYDLLNPLMKLIASNETPHEPILDSIQFMSETKVFPCDLRLVNMRTMSASESEEPETNKVGLIFHRVPYEDCPSAPFVQLSSTLLSQCNNDNYNQFSFGDLFKGKEIGQMKIESTLLTLHTPKVLADDEAPLTSKDFLLNHVQPMQVEAFRVRF